MTPSTQPVVSYLGWHGRGNLGDDAIYDAVTSRLDGALFVDLPRFPHERLKALTRDRNLRARQGIRMMGGGTLIGRRPWRRWVSRGMASTGAGTYAIGVGVEDPVFAGRASGSGRDELKRWSAPLAAFDLVSVRGPRSAELLADIGVEATVSGDPALVLPRPDVAVEDGLIGVNLGFGDDLWGHDPDRVVTAVGAAVRELAQSGHRFVGVLMNRSDRAPTARALDGVDAQIVEPLDAVEASRVLGRCSAVIVSRLHAGILAALSDTPVVALEYQPKCRDFALSIGNEDLLIRTDSVTAAGVVDAVGRALTDANQRRARTATTVAALRGRLTAEYDEVAVRLGL